MALFRYFRVTFNEFIDNICDKVLFITFIKNLSCYNEKEGNFHSVFLFSRVLTVQREIVLCFRISFTILAKKKNSIFS